MKQCVPLYEEEYDGELRFSIVESSVLPNACILTLGGQIGEEIAGFKIEIPMITRRLLFKPFRMVAPAGTVKISSIGEKSDRLLQVLEQVYLPEYPVSGGFSEEPVEIDYTLRNQGAYDVDHDKIYLKLFYDEEQDEDLPKSERVHLNMNFAFNLSRETASLIETKEGYSADLIAFLMNG